MAMTLKHPYHMHALIRKELTDRCSFKCSFCAIEVCGTAYCCEEECGYFILDESCALVEFPQQITEHPFHPDHPLVIQNSRYCCHLCHINLDASIVIATQSPLEEENTIQHVAHDHCLTAFHVKVPNRIDCKGCFEGISGPAYGCHSCSFFLHESCARLPLEILQHPFHLEHPITLLFERENFECSACHTNHFSQAYYCHECEFKLDVACTVLPLLLQDQLKEDSMPLDHFSHEHKLLPGYIEERKHIKLCCAVCELEITGEVYYCLGCILFLHKLCAEVLPKEMVHYLHPEHPLILLPKPPHRKRRFKCGCCQIYYTGMVFHCVTCNFDLDPKCALQTSSAVQDGVASTIQHFGHDHPLTIRHFGKGMKEFFFRCKACNKPTSDLAYGCDKCSYFLHKSCAQLPLLLENPLHPPHPLNLLLKTPPKHFNCDNCCSELSGFSFCCSECDFYLCRICATEIPTLKHELHEHTLSFFCYTQIEKRAWCNSCGKPCHIDLYRCQPCNFNLHSSCLPLPSTVQHECHPYHPLVLFDRFVDGRPDDQYCDYCEEIRNPEHGVYRCAECWYTVHIGCVLPQVTLPVDPEYEKQRKDILSLEVTIKAKEEELQALKEKLRSLQS